MQSKYLSRFKNFGQEELPIRGNRLLVEVLPKQEIKSAGGIVIAHAHDHKSTTDINRPVLAVVLAAGSGYIDEETGAPIDLDIKPGAVVLVSPMGLRYYSHFPGIAESTSEVVAMTRDSEVHICWPTIEAYTEYQAKLSAS